MVSNRVTLSIVARKAALSIATVSRALADHPDISANTKSRVRRIATALGYVPSYRARPLRAAHSSRLIALVVPEMTMFFLPSMIAGINRVLQDKDYSLVVFQSDNALVQERRLIEFCTHLSTDGVLLVLSSETADLAHIDVLKSAGIPVVLLDKTIETSTHTTITINDFEAGREAAAYLIDNGHTRSVGIFGDQRQRISALRLDGFRRAHADRGVPLADSQIIRLTMLDEFQSRFDRAFELHPDATAVFAMSDELLVHSHHQLVKRGVRIPDDVSLLAISDGHAPSFLFPNVTHIRHSGAQEGERAAHILIDMIEHSSPTMMDVRIHTILVELGSVARRALAPTAKRAKAAR